MPISKLEARELMSLGYELGATVLMGDLELPVGRIFKQNVVKFLDH